jgi:hypothetical protein
VRGGLARRPSEFRDLAIAPALEAPRFFVGAVARRRTRCGEPGKEGVGEWVRGSLARRPSKASLRPAHLLTYSLTHDSIGRERTMWKCLAVLASLILLAACGVTSGAMLQPAAGPLFEARAPAIQVAFNRVGQGQGQVRIQMPDGEIINGEYTALAGYSSGTDFNPGTKPGGQLAVTPQDWKALYGSSDMVTTQINGQIVGVGDMGTFLRAEYVMEAMGGRGYGVAKDSKGNLYRLKINVMVY